MTCGCEPGPWVAVEDTGVGIPPEHRDRVLDRFHRLEPSRSRAEGGGLGLAIARRIARLHGAKLALETLAQGAAALSSVARGSLALLPDRIAPGPPVAVACCPLGPLCR